ARRGSATRRDAPRGKATRKEEAGRAPRAKTYEDAGAPLIRFASIAHEARASARALLDLVVVRRCHVCDEAMPPEPRRICDACLSAFEDLSFEGVRTCEGCSLPIRAPFTRCAECAA